jgi:hypothetical protein
VNDTFFFGTGIIAAGDAGIVLVSRENGQAYQGKTAKPIIGNNDSLVQASDSGETFEPVTNISTEASMLTIDDEVIDGEGVVARWYAINGMPVGSYKWSLGADSNFPLFRDFNCISESMAVGSNNGGSLLLRISQENEIIETQASSIRSELRAITRMTGDSYVAVRTGGAVLVLDQAE